MTDITPGTPDDPQHLVTNDAVAGETVRPGGSYAGPNGAEPAEAEPIRPDNSLGAENVGLPDEEGAPQDPQTGDPDDRLL